MIAQIAGTVALVAAMITFFSLPFRSIYPLITNAGDIVAGAGVIVTVVAGSVSLVCWIWGI
jgi:hypothetical protein